MLDEVLRDPRIGVVGTTIVPHRPHPLDRWHWRVSNRIRLWERRSGGTTGLVGGPCYLFRRNLLVRFPDNVIADDVHAVCRAALLGARTSIVDAEVTELRCAPSMLLWYRQKVRRTLGYLREVFRFASTFIHMATPMRNVLLWRALALTMAPVAGLATGILIASTAGLPWLAPAALLLAAGGVRAAPAPARSIQATLAVTALPLWIFVITLTALVLYPFVRQSASYHRFGFKAGESEA